VGDDEVAPIRRELRQCLDHAEVGIALRQIECAKLLLVGSEPVRIVGVVRLEEAEDAARLPRVHLLAQALVGIMRIAKDIDRPDLGEVAFVDLEDDVDSILVELDDLWIDTCRETALSAIELE